MARRRLAAASLAAAASLIALAACSNGGGTASGSGGGSAGTPVNGGTLNMLGAGDVDYMDPNVSYYSVGYLNLRMWSRQLFTYPADPGGKNTAPVYLAQTSCLPQGIATEVVIPALQTAGPGVHHQDLHADGHCQSRISGMSMP